MPVVEFLCWFLQLHRVYNPNSGGVGAMLASPWQQDAQVRCKWANRWMRRDAKRRVLIAERYDDRLHAAIIYRNRTLPPELRVSEAAFGGGGFAVPVQACQNALFQNPCKSFSH